MRVQVYTQSNKMDSKLTNKQKVTKYRTKKIEKMIDNVLYLNIRFCVACVSRYLLFITITHDNNIL